MSGDKNEEQHIRTKHARKEIMKKASFSITIKINKGESQQASVHACVCVCVCV